MAARRLSSRAKKWSKFIALVAILGIVFSSISMAGYPAQNVRKDQVILREKTVQYGPVQRIIGIPQADVNTEYHWAAETAPCLTAADIEKIANIVADILEKRLAATPAGGNDGKDSSGTGGPQASDLEKKFSDIVVQKCGSCHGVTDHGGSLDFVKDGKVQLVDLLGKIPPSDIVWLMYDEAFHGSMPKGKPALTDEEVQTIQEYAAYLTRQERAAK